MAVSGMKKLSVVTMKEDTDGLLCSLQRLRCVDLRQAGDGTEAKPASLDPSPLTKAAAEARTAIDFLSQYAVRSGGWFVSPPEADWDMHRPAGEELAKEAVGLAERLHRVRSELQNLHMTAESLRLWESCPYALPVSETEYTRTLCGILPPAADMDLLREKLAAYACVPEEWQGGMKEGGKRTRPDIALAVTVWRDEAEAVQNILNGSGFVRTPCRVTAEEGGAAGRLRAIGAQEAALTGELDKLREEAASLARRLPELKLYLDRLTTMEARAQAADRLAYTQKAAVLSGWVPDGMTEKVTALLEERGDAYRFDAPEPEDDVPVLLTNNRMASQFEPVVALYSLPAYGSFDPTFLMSFFYILIFGLMFADVGYGLLLTAGCLAGRILLKPAGTPARFINMFAMCGVSMILMGVLFGGYFGDLPQAVMQNFGGRTEEADLSLWFSPLNDPMRFLVISIVIGAVHLFTGLAVQFAVLWKSGDTISAVCDAGSWMMLFAGVGISFLSLGSGLVIAGIGLLMLICTQGRHEKNPIMKLVKGVGSLYGIVNYVSDLLSYSRILSLGLASAVIASVFNIIGTMAGPSVIGVILLLVVGAVGHGMNLAINLLGSFVHTSRLQYIEFFGKFYEDGGRPFTPLAPHTRYVRLK